MDLFWPCVLHLFVLFRSGLPNLPQASTRVQWPVASQFHHLEVAEHHLLRNRTEEKLEMAPHQTLSSEKCGVGSS